MSVINEALGKVMDLIDALGLFASITRGALGTGNGLTCEVAPSSPEATYLDKRQYLPLDVVINGKHSDLDTLSDDMNEIHESLTMLKTYPSGYDWKIVNIETLMLPQIIGREPDNKWIMASNLRVRVYTGYEHEPTPEPDPEPDPEDGTDENTDHETGQEMNERDDT